MEENKDTLVHTIEAWKKTIDVQQHFNEICMRIRNVYVSLLAALIVLLGIVFLRSEDPHLDAGNLEIHSAVIVMLAIFGCSLLFYFIDLHWYHRLLVGAVKNGLEIEKELVDVPGFQLTKTIGDESPLDISSNRFENYFLYSLALLLRADTERVRKEKKLHSNAKLSIFYKSVAFVSALVLVVFVLLGGVSSQVPDAAPSASFQEVLDE